MTRETGATGATGVTGVQPPPSTRRVLVVDDEATIRSFLIDSLRDEDYEVREAENGQAALDLLATWTPHAILLDLYMPVMDGWAFREEQRRLDRAAGVPLILMTASRSIEHVAGM